MKVDDAPRWQRFSLATIFVVVTVNAVAFAVLAQSSSGKAHVAAICIPAVTVGVALTIVGFWARHPARPLLSILPFLFAVVGSMIAIGSSLIFILTLVSLLGDGLR